MNEAVTLNYQDQGFCGIAKQTTSQALRAANDAIIQARNATPKELREQYRSSVRWEGDGYGWYWILR